MSCSGFDECIVFAMSGGTLRRPKGGSRSRDRWQECAGPLLFWPSIGASGTALDGLGVAAHATTTRRLRPVFVHVAVEQRLGFASLRVDLDAFGDGPRTYFGRGHRRGARSGHLLRSVWRLWHTTVSGAPSRLALAAMASMSSTSAPECSGLRSASWNTVFHHTRRAAAPSIDVPHASHAAASGFP